jgi:hypothetical protein
VSSVQLFRKQKISRITNQYCEGIILRLGLIFKDLGSVKQKQKSECRQNKKNNVVLFMRVLFQKVWCIFVHMVYAEKGGNFSSQQLQISKQ